MTIRRGDGSSRRAFVSDGEFGSRPMFRMVLIALCGLGIFLQSGCANVPHVPAEFDLGRARIDAAASAPLRVSPGPHGKVAGAVGGSVAGAAGVGLGVGIISALPCIFLGPYAAPCFAALGPAAAAGAVVGGVTGAAVGARTADSPEDSAAKRELLDTALARLTVRELLIDRLQRRTRESAKIELPVAESNASDATAVWRIAIETIDIAPALTGSDAPYSLLASASLTVREANSGVTVFQKRYQALSPEKRTTTEWVNENAAAARTAVDSLMYALADQMFSNLSREDVAGAVGLSARTHYKR